MRQLLLTVVLVLLPLTGRADEKKEAKPEDLPVKAKLVAKKATYTLDLGGKTGEEYRKMLKDAEKGGRMPAPPAVDLVLEITNTSDQDVKIWSGGDPVMLSLALAGPSAINAKPLLAFTTDFRGPTATTLAPGKSLSIPITKLAYGFRGAAAMSFWTEPGEYKLTATYTTGIQPPPKGTAVSDGFGLATLRAEPVVIKVEAAK